jgi:ERCC4-type nuclease
MVLDTKMKSTELIVAVDTREKQPYQFTKAERKTLVTGDYSIVGLENLIAVERKTHIDAFSSLGRARARFEREMLRLSKLDYAAVVIESSLSEFLIPPAFSRLNPRSAVITLIAWSIKYGVHVFFACDREHGNALTRQLLEKYWHYHHGAKAKAS